MTVIVAPSVHRSIAAQALRGIEGVRIVRVTGSNETQSWMVDGALLAADHIVVDHPELTRNRSTERMLQQARYHAVWSWCTAVACNGPLVRFESWAAWSVVQARSSAAVLNPGIGGSLEVRSTLSPGWRALPQSARGDESAVPPLRLPRGMWTRPDVCVAYGVPRPCVWLRGADRTKYSDRKMLLLQVAPGGGAPLWPLRWPRHYEDGNPEPYRQADGRFDMPFAEIAALGRRDPRIFARPKWLRDRAAVMVELTMDNLFHSLFHLLPLREDLHALGTALRQGLKTALRSGRRSSLSGGGGPSAVPSAATEAASGSGTSTDAMGAASTGAVNARNGSATDADASSCCRGVDLLPRYTVLWPGATPHGAAAWHGWSLALRLLSTALRGVDDRAAVQHAARTDALLEPLQLHCYGVVIGGHSSFWPSFYDAAALLAVRSRLTALRRALWASFELHARAEASAAADELPSALFVERKSLVRAIVNMGELRAALNVDATLAGRVKLLQLEALPLAEQLCAVSAASVLVGVHGQGMLWTAMLPTERSGRRCATLELMPEQMTTISTKAWLDYRRWAFMNGAEYFTLVQPDAPECAELGFRECGNITANTSQVGAALREVFRHTAMPLIDRTPIGQTPEGLRMPASDESPMTNPVGHEGNRMTAAASSSLYEFSAYRETRLEAARRSARWNVVPGAYVRLECIHNRREAAAPVASGVQTAVGPLPAGSGSGTETFLRICAVVWRLPGKPRKSSQVNSSQVKSSQVKMEVAWQAAQDG